MWNDVPEVHRSEADLALPGLLKPAALSIRGSALPAAGLLREARGAESLARLSAEDALAEEGLGRRPEEDIRGSHPVWLASVSKRARFSSW